MARLPLAQRLFVVSLLAEKIQQSILMALNRFLKISPRPVHGDTFPSIHATEPDTRLLFSIRCPQIVHRFLISPK